MISGLAIHEAGHCVAAVVTGIGAVDRVTLDPPVTYFTRPDAWAHGGRPNKLPRTPSINRKGTPSLPDRTRWRLAAVRLIAGVVAEARFTGEPFGIVFKRNGADRRSVEAFLDGLTSDPAARDALRHELLLETRHLVGQHWGAIVAVARALSISKELLGCEVERIIRRAQVAA